MGKPLLSVIVPVHNGGRDFERCLAALETSQFESWELIVVDDGSSDGSGDKAAERGARVATTESAGGPGAARNLGATLARGDLLMFIDADCLVTSDTLSLAVKRLIDDPGVDAVFGTYDEAPSARSFIGRYKNLYHAYTHQRGHPDAATFWAGCGAVRKAAFDSVGGFDAERFERPCIEDIELGYRLRAAGYEIRLCPEIRVKHLKKWTLGSMLRSDVFDRGIPWTRLMLTRGTIDSTLNLRWTERVRAVVAWLIVFGALGAPFVSGAKWVVLGSLVGFLALNQDLYRFFYRAYGARFAIAAVPLHWFYYLYSTLAFIIGLGGHVWSHASPGRRLAALSIVSFVISAPAAEAQEQTCAVAFVVDGDEFNCSSGENVRLLWIDAPDGGRFGELSRNALASLLPSGREVRVEVDRRERDKDGRLLAYVFLESDRMVNELMLRHGYAFLEPSVDNRRFAVRLRAAEAAARRQGRGIWAE